MSVDSPNSGNYNGAKGGRIGSLNTKQRNSLQPNGLGKITSSPTKKYLYGLKVKSALQHSPNVSGGN